MSTASESVRPEWLYEIVQRVQSLLARSGDNPAEVTFKDLSPASELERAILRELLARAAADRLRWSLCFRGDASGVDDAETLMNRTCPRVDLAIAKARDLLERDVATRWTVAGLARRVACNRTDLESGFRRCCGYAVHTYLTICRVGAAKQLLRNTAWRIEEVGKASGFRSKVSLYEHFHRNLRMTPDTYRRRWTLTAPSAPVRALLRGSSFTPRGDQVELPLPNHDCQF